MIIMVAASSYDKKLELHFIYLDQKDEFQFKKLNYYYVASSANT